MRRLHLFLFFILLLLVVYGPLSAQSSKENADFKLAINLFNDKLYDLAAEQLRQFINSFPNASQAIEAKYFLGLSQMRLGHLEEARITFQTLALTHQDNPRAPEAWWQVGESYAAAGNFKEAALAFERVKVFHPRSKSAADALVEASKYFSRSGQTDDARRVLRIVLQEYGSSSASLTARAWLGKIYFEEGNLELAQNELKRVINGDPSPEAKAQALLILGNINEALGRWDMAESNYQSIISEYKTSTAAQGAFVSMGSLLSTTGKYEQAVANFKKGLAGTGADSTLLQRALIGAGDAYASLGNHTSAVASYDQYVAMFERKIDVGDVLWKSALVNAQAKKYAKSNQACMKILRSSENKILRRRAQIKLATNAIDQNNHAQAVQYYAQFLDQFPDDPKIDEIVYRIGSLQETFLDDPRKAITYFEILETRHPESSFIPDALAGIGVSYERLQEFDRALHWYGKFLQKFPGAAKRAEIEKRKQKIEVFEAKNKDASLDKLAMLVGDVLAESDKAGVAFRLGEVYFSDLKNYEGAAVQFQNSLNNGLTGPLVGDAMIKKARSHEYLSWRNEQRTVDAVQSYREFLQQFPTDPRSEQAALSLFVLNASSVTAARQAFIATLSLYPSFKRRDTLPLIVGQLQLASGENDSALATFRTIARDYSSSLSSEAALASIVHIYGEEKHWDSVRAVGKKYLSMFPDGSRAPGILEMVATASIAKGYFADVTESLHQLRSKYPYFGGSPDRDMQLANAYTEVGHTEESISILMELVKSENGNPLRENGADPELFLALGNAYHASGKFAEAKKYLLEFLANRRTGEQAGRAYYLLGTIYREEGVVDLATAYFRQAGTASPVSSSNVEVAAMLFESGEYADAIKQYSQLLISDSLAVNTRLYRARTIVARLRSNELGAADKDIAAFGKQFKPTDEEAALFELERGSYFFRKTDFANAQKSFEKVADKYNETPSAPDAMYWIGKLYEANNKPKEAIKRFQKLKESHPHASILPRVYLSLGNIYYSAEQWDEAIRHYRLVVDAEATNPEILPYAMSNLINTYEVAGANDAALSLTRRYIEQYPNNEDTFDKRIKIGILYQRLGYNEQSVLHLQTLLEQAGSDLEGELRYYIGEGYYNKGDYQQAILEFLKVPYLVTKKGKLDWTANSLYMSGQSYEKMGRYDQALTMYKQIIERSGIDETFKAAAKKEIDRVQLVLKKSN